MTTTEQAAQHNLPILSTWNEVSEFAMDYCDDLFVRWTTDIAADLEYRVSHNWHDDNAESGVREEGGLSVWDVRCGDDADDMRKHLRWCVRASCLNYYPICYMLTGNTVAGARGSDNEPLLESDFQPVAILSDELVAQLR